MLSPTAPGGAVPRMPTPMPGAVPSDLSWTPCVWVRWRTKWDLTRNSALQPVTLHRNEWNGPLLQTLPLPPLTIEVAPALGAAVPPAFDPTAFIAEAAAVMRSERIQEGADARKKRTLTALSGVKHGARERYKIHNWQNTFLTLFIK